MDLTRLQHIVALARTGNFSRAAEGVNVTQPALSRSIASFEARHGLRLFDRGRGGVVPTAAGRMVIAQAQAILGATRELEDSLDAHAAGEVGNVALGLGPLAACLLMPDLARALLAARPRLRLQLAIKTPAALLEDLATDRVEFVLAAPWPNDDFINFEIEPITSLPLAFVTRAEHPLAGRANLRRAELSSYPFASAIENVDGSMTGEVGGVTCDNYHILRETALATDCIWLTSPIIIANEIARGQLVMLDMDERGRIDNEIALIRRRGRTPSPAALAVVADARALLVAAANSA
jgi:Transcriptional regulator